MISLLRGDVAVRRADHVVVVCGGVGYRLAVSAHTLQSIPAVGSEVTLHSHLVLRDDAIALYGFFTEAERELFLMLVSVPQVGPKVALGVLSGGPPGEIVGALATGDVARFQAAPGVGKRTAERIVSELRERALAAPEAGTPIVLARTDDPRALARQGLLELGLASGEVDGLLGAAQGATPEELIAQALRAAQIAPAPGSRARGAP